MNKKDTLARVAAVVIGRNEGQRLINCLESLLMHTGQIVYVDSGSTDNSVEAARRRGVATISLDMNIPFTAARARNEGADYVMKNYSQAKYLQFIDGDCEIHSLWIQSAMEFLDSHNDYSVVCGRRREHYPEKSIYNQLCDIEWNTPVGDAQACGGDAMMRVNAFEQVNGFNSTLIAGEEPELCFRLREQGWKIRRLDVEMTLHDVAMTKFSQWWNRTRRSGYAYASCCFLHGRTDEKFKIKEVISILGWGLIMPLSLVLMAILDERVLLAFLLYPIQILRLMAKNSRCLSTKLAFYYAISNIIGKFPQSIGIIQFVANTVKKRHGTLIEYK